MGIPSASYTRSAKARWLSSDSMTQVSINITRHIINNLRKIKKAGCRRMGKAFWRFLGGMKSYDKRAKEKDMVV